MGNFSTQGVIDDSAGIFGILFVYKIWLFCTGELGIMSRLLGSVDSEEMKENKIAQLDPRIQQCEEYVKNTNQELL